VEGYAAELACRAHGAELAKTLDAICTTTAGVIERMAPHDEFQLGQVIRLNDEFHAVIREAAGSRTVIRVAGTLASPAFVRRQFLSNDPVRSRQAQEDHRKITQAFAKGKAELARTLMERHLLDARDYMLASLAARTAGAST
jgi:DNA-binding GntR family transcriptional regulator